MTYKTAKTLKINTLTIADVLKGISYFNPDAKGSDGEALKDKHVPLFEVDKKRDRQICVSISEALAMGGFKNLNELRLLKGIGPKTFPKLVDKLKSIGLTEYVYFFYKEDAASSGVTRVSNFFTLKQVKHKHPSGANWHSPNPDKQISAEFCGGAMETVTWPGQKRKGKKVKLKPRVADDGMKLILEFGHHLLMKENQVFEGKRMVGWNVRGPDGEVTVLPVPDGLTSELIREVVSMRTIKCRLADVQRDGSIILHEKGTSYRIAPNSEQTHKVKLRKAIPGVTDVDFDIENMTTEQEQKYREALQAQMDEDLKKENAERAKEGKNAKLSAEDFQQLLEDTYIEYHSGFGLQMRKALVERDEAHAKVDVYTKARTMGLELPYSKEEFAKATTAWHGACKKLGDLKRLNPVNNMMYLYKTYIQGQETEEYLEDKLNLSNCGLTYTSGDAKMSGAIEKRLGRAEGNGYQMVRPDGVLREDTSWEQACVDEVKANMRERLALTLGGRRDQKLPWKELMSKLDAVLLFAKFGRKEMKTILRGSSRWISGEWTGGFRYVEVAAGRQANYEVVKLEHGRACVMLPGYKPEEILTIGCEDVVEICRIPIFTRGHLETTPDRPWLIPAVPKPSTEEEYEDRLEEGLMRLQF
jgi:hypothetical protein